MPCHFEAVIPHELSGGQRQHGPRTCLHRPKLLILDERDLGAGPYHAACHREIAQTLTAEAYNQLCLMSHDLQVVKALCQKVLVLRQCAGDEEIQDTEQLFLNPQTEYTGQLIEASQYV